MLNVPCPSTIEEKKAMLLCHGIALWDVIASCEITGSSDGSIKNVLPNDISVILSEAQISTIITNGKKASELYRKYIFPSIKIEDVCLPSTSPANACYTLNKLTLEWNNVLKLCISLPNLNLNFH